MAGSLPEARQRTLAGPGSLRRGFALGARHASRGPGVGGDYGLLAGEDEVIRTVSPAFASCFPCF